MLVHCFRTTFLNIWSSTQSTPAISRPKTTANMNTARVRRQVSRRFGHVTCLTSRQEFTKYDGTSHRKGRNSGRNGQRIIARTLPSVRSTPKCGNFFLATEALEGFWLDCVLSRASSACSRTLSALRTRTFFSLRPDLATVSLPYKKPTV